jgi:tetratricopeptide (TPR) repeat protein
MNQEANSRFVRSAWVLLLFQLAAAAVALSVTAWATFRVQPLLAKKERLETVVRAAQTRLRELDGRATKAQTDLAGVQRQLEGVRSELEGAREATPALIEAINAFHRRQYGLAITRYDEALRLNPGDPYIYNLKSYSQFKAGNLAGAVATMAKSLELEPTYDWGYFDLARYQCASGAGPAAVETLRAAIAKRGSSVKALARVFLVEDGEFRRVCASVLPQMRALVENES